MNLNSNKIYLVAEIGWNFLGRLSLAKKMIISAKNSGADCVKFQIWNPKYLKSGPWDYDGRRLIYEKAYLNKTKYALLNKFCEKNKMKCFSSIFSKTEIKSYREITSDIVKIPSSEACNFELINLCLKKFKLVMISCGALKKKELKRLLSLVRGKKVILMHCVSSYPLKSSNANFAKFKFLKSKLKNIGYSGHFEGIEDAIYAIDLGAKVIEKHFTINNNLEGRDNKFALLPQDFKFLKRYILLKKDFDKNKGLDIQKCELDIYKNYRGRWQLQ